MKVIKPMTIADANLVSSSVAETDFAAWSSGSTYALGDKVILTSTHRIYQSLQAGNTNHNPTDAASVWWGDIGPTNRWAMLDGKVSTQTSDTDSIEIVLAPGVASDGLALLNLDAVTTVTVTVTSDAVEVYSSVQDMTGIVSDWSEYFFDPIEFKTDITFDDLPFYADAEITVLLEGSGTIACGVLVLGRVHDLGITRMGAKLGITDYSKKESDEFGNPVGIVQRAFAKRFSVDLVLDRARVDPVARLLASLRATPAVWIGDETNYYTSLIAYGFYKQFEETIAYYSHSLCALEIEGLT